MSSNQEEQKVIPAIIPESLSDLEKTLGTIKDFTQHIQVDVVDGNFVPFTSWPYSETQPDFNIFKSAISGFKVDLDLMARESMDGLYKWLDSGVSRIIFHVESVDDLRPFIEHSVSKGVSCGLAINNGTPIEKLTGYLADVDVVQCMGIADIGAQGLPFDERVLERITHLRESSPDLNIMVDGSVNVETLPRLKEAGANLFVSGSAILKAENPEKAYRELQSLL